MSDFLNAGLTVLAPLTDIVISDTNQSGFLSHSRSLLAWEVPLKNASFGSLAERWPNLAEAALKKQQASDVLDKCECRELPLFFSSDI